MIRTPPSTDRTETNRKLLRAGVIGVGSMGTNHARVYRELDGVELVGVTDRDEMLAEEVAHEYDTDAIAIEELIATCDLVTVAVPTTAHESVVSTCLEAGVHVLVEKPITDSVRSARRLARRAADAGVVLQVGHIERFNPAVQAVQSLISDLDVLAITAERLGPPLDRAATDVVLDLMIHDVDVVGSLIDDDPDTIAAHGTDDGQYATATACYDDVVVTYTASRVTQRKVRRLRVTASECLVDVDYLDQSVVIHRESTPSYVTADGESHYRNETVVERPRIPTGEPLQRELDSFVQAVRTGSTPAVTATDGIDALETVHRIDRALQTGTTATNRSSRPSRESSLRLDSEVQSR